MSQILHILPYSGDSVHPMSHEIRLRVKPTNTTEAPSPEKMRSYSVSSYFLSSFRSVVNKFRV